MLEPLLVSLRNRYCTTPNCQLKLPKLYRATLQDLDKSNRLRKILNDHRVLIRRTTCFSFHLKKKELIRISKRVNYP